MTTERKCHTHLIMVHAKKFFFFAYMYMCVCMLVHAHAFHIHRYASLCYTHAHRRQKRLSGAFLYHSPLRQGLSMNWKLTISTRMAGQRDARVCLPLPLNTGFASMFSHAWLLMQTNVFCPLNHLPTL